MYISLVTFRDTIVSDAERKGLQFATGEDGCLWTRHATQNPDSRYNYATDSQDVTVDFWFSRWESVEHHQKFLQSKGLPDIVSKSSDFEESLSVFNSNLGPEDAVSAVLLAPVIEVVTVKIPNKNDTAETRDCMRDALKKVERVVSQTENTRGSLTGVLVEHQSSLYDYMNGKAGGLILIGLDTVKDSVFEKFPTLYSIMSMVGSVELNHVVFSNW